MAAYYLGCWAKWHRQPWSPGTERRLVEVMVLARCGCAAGDRRRATHAPLCGRYHESRVGKRREHRGHRRTAAFRALAVPAGKHWPGPVALNPVRNKVGFS